MLPAQRNKIDISKLTPEQQTAFRLYGKLPANAKSLAKKPAPRQYFDSGDYAMSKSGQAPEQPIGTEHPSPETIPHATNGNLSGIPIPGTSPSPSTTAIPSSSPSSVSPINSISIPAPGQSLSPGKSSPPSLTTVGVAALPSPASAHATPAPGLGNVPLAAADNAKAVPNPAATVTAAGVGETEGENEHGTPIMSPPPPQSPIKASRLGQEVIAGEEEADVEMESGEKI